MVGRTIDHYEVVEKLGEGGMGAVYKAHDLRLDRFVAIKLLPSAPAGREWEAARLAKEAKAVSALNHPNIAVIHGTGEFEGSLYLVFEYLSGGPLRRRIQPHPCGLPLGELIAIARQAGEGLAHAHRRGVIHRDVKTDNMLLSEEGTVKITDFGLALRGAGRDTGGQAGAGTAAYMSPEQAEGADVDVRADIFSFGIVLFELATGRVPFDGPHPASIAYDILHTPTPSILAWRPDLPPAIDGIIQKATAKDPGDRYASMEELLGDLDAIEEPSGAPPSPEPAVAPKAVDRRRIIALGASALAAAAIWFGTGFFGAEDAPAGPAEVLAVAVLPFDNRSSDPAQDYLADGITEALITDLAPARSLRVTSRTSVMPYRRSPKSAPRIAEELGVDRIVQGSVARAGDRIRVTMQLIDGRTDENLWAEVFEDDFSNVLALEQRLAGALLRQLEGVPASAKRAPPPESVREIDPAAYAAYIRGRLAAYEWTRDGIQRSLRELGHAIELDPEYAEAHAAVAITYGLMAVKKGAPPDEAWPKARAAAERALKINPLLSQAHTALGFVAAAYDLDWGAAERSFRRALSINPNSVDARHALALTVLDPLGRLDEAIEIMREARQADPLSPSVATGLADLLAAAGDFSGAEREFQAALDIEPLFAEALREMGYLRLMEQRPDEAAELLGRALELDGGRERNPVLAALVHAARGERSEAGRMLTAAETKPLDSLDAAWTLAAAVRLYLGQPDRALDNLERALEAREPTAMRIPNWPLLAGLHGHPRFEALLVRMGIREQ